MAGHVDRRRAARSRAGDRARGRLAAAGRAAPAAGHRGAPARRLPGRHRHRRRPPGRAAGRALPAVRVPGRRADPVRGRPAPLGAGDRERRTPDGRPARHRRGPGDVGRHLGRDGPALRWPRRSRAAAHRRRARRLGSDRGAAAAGVRPPGATGALAADVGGGARRSDRRPARRHRLPRGALRRLQRAAVAPGGDAHQHPGRRRGRRGSPPRSCGSCCRTRSGPFRARPSRRCS